IRRQIALRRRSAALSPGRQGLLGPTHRKVLAFLRARGEEGGRVVANPGRTPRPGGAGLAPGARRCPRGGCGPRGCPPRRAAPVRQIGPAPYLIPLGRHSFHRFELRREPEEVAARLAPVRTEKVEVVPEIDVHGGWESVLEGAARASLERDALPGFLRSQRWF